MYSVDGLGRNSPTLMKLGPVLPHEVEMVRNSLRGADPAVVKHPPIDKFDSSEIAMWLSRFYKNDFESKFDDGTKTKEVCVVPEKEACATPGAEVSCLLFFKIDVGTLPPLKAEAYIERLKDQWKPIFSRLPSHVGILYCPVRAPEKTGIEVIQIPGKCQ